MFEKKGLARKPFGALGKVRRSVRTSTWASPARTTSTPVRAGPVRRSRLPARCVPGSGSVTGCLAEEDAVRRHDEVIEVRQGRIGEGIAGLEPAADPLLLEGPCQFLWRERLWRVLQVQARWVESGAWWDSPGVRAARGDWEPDPVDPFAPGASVPGASAPGGPVDDEDLLCEQEVWRVEAACGRVFSRGVYELVHGLGNQTWRLRTVMD